MPVQTRRSAQTAAGSAFHYIGVQEVMITQAVFMGEQDAIVALPIPQTTADIAHIRFRGIYLSTRTFTTTSKQLNDAETAIITDRSPICVETLKCYTEKMQTYVLVRIHTTDEMRQEAKNCGNANLYQFPAVFGFEYWCG